MSVRKIGATIEVMGFNTSAISARLGYKSDLKYFTEPKQVFTVRADRDNLNSTGRLFENRLQFCRVICLPSPHSPTKFAAIKI